MSEMGPSAPFTHASGVRLLHPKEQTLSQADRTAEECHFQT